MPCCAAAGGAEARPGRPPGHVQDSGRDAGAGRGRRLAAVVAAAPPSLRALLPGGRRSTTRRGAQPLEHLRLPAPAPAPQRPRRAVAARAGSVDELPPWTLDQIAGLVFGGVLLAFLLSAPAVDAWFARRQRQQLGLCERCGGVNDAATCREGACPLRGAAAAAAAAAGPAAQQQQQQQQQQQGGQGQGGSSGGSSSG
ncbi:hypothetical protein Rsub_00586 [Raphidocelis subcapitata]|uniref:Uncharacterized protein n=1 Tax=Raphidocelis subcapitata TaxID=307507 RepID=A0A2V0NKL2_9CHLO|nr:hypothetical protein Rsub_00586 [Raphidocelis subcapitata]|eukprot:GBF87874.1 hypothetical protein Rsub_00586 [Raphidocelis subcapitata]